jgi:hypothetical protein
MKTFNQVLDFLEAQQQEDKLNTNQLHLIIQTLTTFLNKEQMQEVENLFNQRTQIVFKALFRHSNDVFSVRWYILLFNVFKSVVRWKIEI